MLTWTEPQCKSVTVHEEAAVRWQETPFLNKLFSRSKLSYDGWYDVPPRASYLYGTVRNYFFTLVPLRQFLRRLLLHRMVAGGNLYEYDGCLQVRCGEGHGFGKLQTYKILFEKRGGAQLRRLFFGLCTSVQDMRETKLLHF